MLKLGEKIINELEGGSGDFNQSRIWCEKKIKLWKIENGKINPQWMPNRSSRRNEWRERIEESCQFMTNLTNPIEKI